MYGEDLDLNYKINTSGYAVHYLPHIRIVHHGGTSSSQRGTFFVPVRQRESIAQFLRSTRGALYFTLYRLAVAFVAAVRMLLVVLSIPLGGRVFRRTDRHVVLGRWLANFRWALGFSDRRASS
jgi:GT2 family glycosyltransferase